MTKGRGVSSSVVSAFSESRDREENSVAREILLGVPVGDALSRLKAVDRAILPLLNYLKTESRVSAMETGKSAQRLIEFYEHWLEAKERREVERRVMALRAHMTSAILGAVTAFIATLSPLLGSLQFFLSAARPDPLPMLITGGVMAGVSSFFLGLYMNPRRPYVDFVICMVCYYLSYSFVSPLLNFSL
jgi:hypothetical protein